MCIPLPLLNLLTLSLAAYFGFRGNMVSTVCGCLVFLSLFYVAGCTSARARQHPCFGCLSGLCVLCVCVFCVFGLCPPGALAPTRPGDYMCVFHLTKIDDYSDARKFYTTPFPRMRESECWREAVCAGVKSSQCVKLLPGRMAPMKDKSFRGETCPIGEARITIH